MKKKIVFAICILCVLVGVILFSTNKSREVPESVIHEKFFYAIGTGSEVVDISHNYDKDTHTDDVTVVLRTEQEYGIYEYTGYLKYQYYSSDDLWELVYEDSSNKTYWNEEKLKTTWYGDNWWVEIHNVDNENEKFTCSYQIDYLSDYYYNYGELIGSLIGHNETYGTKLYQSCIEKKDNMGNSRFVTIELDIHNGVVVTVAY